MNNASASSRRTSDPANATVAVRLAPIEEHLDEIIRRLDELKYLVTMLDRVQPNRQRTVEDWLARRRATVSIRIRGTSTRVISVRSRRW